MARGTLYHITTDPGSLGTMSGKNFDDRLDEIHCDYVRDMSEKDACRSLDILRDMLEAHGFKTGTSENTENLAFTIEPMGTGELYQCRRRYFHDCLRKAKTIMNNMTEAEFQTDSISLYRLKEAIDNKHNDAVCMENEYGHTLLQTMDMAMRLLKPDTRYYVADSTILMH